jgi:hypothetical protein
MILRKYALDHGGEALHKDTWPLEAYCSPVVKRLHWLKFAPYLGNSHYLSWLHYLVMGLSLLLDGWMMC